MLTLSSLMITDLNRRNFLTRAGSAVSAVWISAHWPAIVAAAEHAHQAAKSASPAKFQFFSPEQAVEIDAIAARIIPTDETPGAKEAGVVYFIDRALVTFASDSQKTYREGLADVNALLSEKFPGVKKFSAASPEQQDAVLEALSNSKPNASSARRNRPNANGQPFFDTL